MGNYRKFSLARIKRADVERSGLGRRLAVSLLVCTAGGVLCLVFVLWRMGPNPMGMALSILYERFLIGAAIGFGGGLRLRPVVRGGLLGLLLSFVWSIVFLSQGRIVLAIVHCVFGIIYGGVADVLASSRSTRK